MTFLRAIIVAFIVVGVLDLCKRQILRSLPNYAPLFIGGAYCNIQLEVLSTMA